MVFNTLNMLKWAGQLAGCEVVILHRGAAGDRKSISGGSITEVKKSYFLFREVGRETFIPNRRVLEIRAGGKVVWKRA